MADILKTYPPEEYGRVEVHEYVKRSLMQMLSTWPRPPSSKGMAYLLEQVIKTLSAPEADSEKLGSDALQETIDV